LILITKNRYSGGSNGGRGSREGGGGMEELNRGNMVDGLHKHIQQNAMKPLEIALSGTGRGL
jgi:hypothetical protein